MLVDEEGLRYGLGTSLFWVFSRGSGAVERVVRPQEVVVVGVRGLRTCWVSAATVGSVVGVCPVRSFERRAGTPSQEGSPARANYPSQIYIHTDGTQAGIVAIEAAQRARGTPFHSLDSAQADERAAIACTVRTNITPRGLCAH